MENLCNLQEDKNTHGFIASITQHNTLLTRDKYKHNMKVCANSHSPGTIPASEDEVHVTDSYDIYKINVSLTVMLYKKINY